MSLRIIGEEHSWFDLGSLFTLLGFLSFLTFQGCHQLWHGHHGELPLEQVSGEQGLHVEEGGARRGAHGGVRA